MEMASESGGSRHRAIVTAISEELRRQALSGAQRIDVDAMAGAIEDVIADDGDGSEANSQPPLDEDGKEPDELNASNDG